MNPRIRTLSLAGAALAIFAVTGCSTLPVQPVIETPATASARMMDPDVEQGGGSDPAVIPGGETATPTVDRTPGKGPKAKKKPKRNPH